jgi:hypothetical protein
MTTTHWRPVHSTKAVLEIFHAVKAAMRANDPIPLQAHVAEDYQGSDAGGRLHDRELMLTLYGAGGIKLEEFEVSEVETKSWAGTVLVSGKAFIRGAYGEHTFEHTLRFLDVYAERGAGWKLVASHVTDIVPS